MPATLEKPADEAWPRRRGRGRRGGAAGRGRAPPPRRTTPLRPRRARCRPRWPATAGSVERVWPAAANDPAASSAPRPVTTRVVGFTGTRAAITSSAAPMTARSTERPTPSPSTWSRTPGSVIAPIPRPVERMAWTGSARRTAAVPIAGGCGEETAGGGPVAVQAEPGEDGPAPGGQQQARVGDAAQGGGHGLPRLLALLVQQRVEEALAELGRRPDGEDEPAVDRDGCRPR